MLQNIFLLCQCKGLQLRCGQKLLQSWIKIAVTFQQTAQWQSRRKEPRLDMPFICQSRIPKKTRCRKGRDILKLGRNAVALTP
ncbi:hypothetical protein A6769_10555 [Nostoc punctiforme NIES-2108]|uniref:Uncharacterized protein n=1 Tax=Nostoc punctiforme NIES-2108 TaxID=1356359 RepID=A0A367RNP4_NOSPU|nr:hypothetical protein A6769_10555 [Nostoc punctiforme NIES-2108]